MQFISQSIVSNQFKTNKYAIYHKSFQYFTINFETMKEECRSNFHKFETRERLKNKHKKVVILRFLSSESCSWVKLPRHQPLIHHKYVTIKEQPKKEKNQLCILGFLVRVDVYPILLHLKIFLGTHEPYFSHYFFKKMIAL